MWISWVIRECWLMEKILSDKLFQFQDSNWPAKSSKSAEAVLQENSESLFLRKILPKSSIKVLWENPLLNNKKDKTSLTSKDSKLLYLEEDCQDSSDPKRPENDSLSLFKPIQSNLPIKHIIISTYQWISINLYQHSFHIFILHNIS